MNYEEKLKEKIIYTDCTVWDEKIKGLKKITLEMVHLSDALAICKSAVEEAEKRGKILENEYWTGAAEIEFLNGNKLRVADFQKRISELTKG